jgi:hypothetical protein
MIRVDECGLGLSELLRKMMMITWPEKRREINENFGFA